MFQSHLSLIMQLTFPHWNFVCFPFSLWVLSHFNTKSPTSKLLDLVNFLLNQLFFHFWCMTNLSLYLSLSSSILIKVSIILWNRIHGFPWDSWENCKARRYILGGKIASLPYKRNYGEDFEVPWSTHSVFTIELC